VRKHRHDRSWDERPQLLHHLPDADTGREMK
jgi:hypothetical protein